MAGHRLCISSTVFSDRLNLHPVAMLKRSSYEGLVPVLILDCKRSRLLQLDSPLDLEAAVSWQTPFLWGLNGKYWSVDAFFFPVILQPIVTHRPNLSGCLFIRQLEGRRKLRSTFLYFPAYVYDAPGWGSKTPNIFCLTTNQFAFPYICNLGSGIFQWFPSLVGQHLIHFLLYCEVSHNIQYMLSHAFSGS